MKKLIALVIAVIMVVSMIPVMALSTSAAADGEWNVLRNPNTYDAEAEGEVVIPAPGYQYTNEGLTTIAPDWSNYTPFFTVQTKDAKSLKDGFFMEVRIDDYPYGGEDGSADHWISFNISDRENVAPGSVDFGENWLCLIRGAGAGAAEVQSFITNLTTDETPGSFPIQGTTSVTAPMDDDGRETYTFEVSHDGTKYDLKVNGVTVGGIDAVSAKLDSMNENGELYVGVTMHCGIKDATTSITITKAGLAYLAELPIRVIDVDASKIILGDYSQAVLVKNASKQIDNGLQQRDAGIRAGALGCTTVVMRDGELILPPDWSIDENEPDVAAHIKEVSGMVDEDIIIIGSADNKVSAINAALSAAFELF